MVLNNRLDVLVIILLLVPFASCVELDLIDCGVDHDLEVTVGDVEITYYPWVGILYYSYYGESGETRAVTTVILIQSEFVIANAADIGPMPKHDFRKKSRVLLGEKWPTTGRRVRNYVLHPEYGETYNTVALVQLKDAVKSTTIKPACPAPEMLRNPVFYVMKFQEDYNVLQKQVIPVAHIPGQLCKEFYVKANLYSVKMRPPHVVCAVSLAAETPCVWDAGAALVSRDMWGRWMLLGVGARGPGCGAPARFLDMSSYAPWIRQSLNRFQRITISKINKQKYVLRSNGELAGGTSSFARFGACDPEEKINCLYRDLIKLETDNMQFQFLTYNMTISETVEYTCLTLELVNASAVSQMQVKHLCLRENFGAPCYYYKGSLFTISVFIIFSEGCMFEMYAWGHRKTMKLLDIQEWKWEEGSYYEDFSTQRNEYRGQKYMSDFGYEPIDQKMWVPEYDIWTTSSEGPPITAKEVKIKYLDENEQLAKEQNTPKFVYIPSTSSTLTPPTQAGIFVTISKKRFRLKTTIPPGKFWWGYQ